MEFVQIVVSGIALGAIYAIVAFGFTLVWNASGTVNFAQGQLVVAGAFIGYTLIVQAGLPYALAVPLSMLAGFALGVVLERLTIRPVRNLDPLVFIIITIGTAIALETLMRNIWGPATRTIPGISGGALIHVGGVIITAQSLWVIGIGALLSVLLQLLLSRTMVGRAMRAVAQDRETAAQMGVPVSAMVALTFGLNGMLAALAGVLLAPTLFVSAGLGTSVTLEAFAAAVLGGFGSLPGAVAGGLLLGLSQQLSSAYISGGYGDAISLVILILVLVIRPRGLLRTAW